MEGAPDQLFPWLPSEATETRVVVPVVLSTDSGNGLNGLDAGTCPFNLFGNPLTVSVGGVAVVGGLITTGIAGSRGCDWAAVGTATPGTSRAKTTVRPNRVNNRAFIVPLLSAKLQVNDARRGNIRSHAEARGALKRSADTRNLLETGSNWVER